MKFGYDGADLSELIENYKVCNDRIFIRFLEHENDYNIPYDKESEKNIISKMINQAIERDKNIDLSEISRVKDEILGFTLLSSSFSLLFLVGFLLSNSASPNSVLGIFGGVAALASGAFGYTYQCENERVEELKKYRLYLTMMEKLENNSDLDLYNGINLDEKKAYLNINTIDNYSLKEVEIINNNLALRENKTNPVLIKK